MNKITARIKALIANPSKDIAAINDQLSMLKSEMERIKTMPNKVEAIIELFRVISPLQDTGGFSQTVSKLQEKNYGQIDTAIAALESLQKHFKNAGRNEYGINRTKKGEAITAANVWLGDVFGIWTKSAAFWLENQKRFENDFRHDLAKDPNRPVTTWYCINDYKAGAFVESHVNGILNQIGILQKTFALA